MILQLLERGWKTAEPLCGSLHDKDPRTGRKGDFIGLGSPIYLGNLIFTLTAISPSQRFADLI
jgi:hypothetical protein